METFIATWKKLDQIKLTVPIIKVISVLPSLLQSNKCIIHIYAYVASDEVHMAIKTWRDKTNIIDDIYKKLLCTCNYEILLFLKLLHKKCGLILPYKK